MLLSSAGSSHSVDCAHLLTVQEAGRYLITGLGRVGVQVERENTKVRDSSRLAEPSACVLGSPSPVRRSELSHPGFPETDHRRRNSMDVSPLTQP